MSIWCLPWLLVATGWELQPLSGPLPADGQPCGPLRLVSARFAAGDDGLTARLTVAASPDTSGQTRLALVLYDNGRRPLTATTAAVDWRAPTSPWLHGAVRWELELPLGPQPTAQWYALGELPPRPARGNLLTPERGARVLATSSNYGGSYGPEQTLLPPPHAPWASATGSVREQWLLYALGGDGPVRCDTLGLNPRAESGAPTCALRDFTLLVSDGTDPAGEFRPACAGRCELPKPPRSTGGFTRLEGLDVRLGEPPQPPAGEAADDDLQWFHFAPVAARLVKLVCHTNHGSDQWLELTQAQLLAAPPAEQSLPVVPLDDFDTPGRTVAVDLHGCRSAVARTERETVGLLRCHYEFGNLLGGAPQWCGLVLDQPLAGRPARLQLRVRSDRPANGLRLVLTDADGDALTYDLGPSGSGWRTVGCDLGQRPGLRRLAWPLRLSQVQVVPHGRDGVSGTLAVAEVLALANGR